MGAGNGTKFWNSECKEKAEVGTEKTGRAAFTLILQHTADVAFTTNLSKTRVLVQGV